MRRFVSMLMGAALLVTGVSGTAALAQAHGHQHRDDQGQARKAMRDGNVRSLREIEQSVLPRMKGAQYLGPEYDSAAMAYRLKFIRDGRVTFVDVDARSGRILGISR
ncbi:MAG TPA: PepSY domain-containing protein [Croceibacterium sp.]|nr:PepSY domain-containing protein [Croceibacterium sp.]